MIEGINKKQIEDKQPCIYIFQPKDNQANKVYIGEERDEVSYSDKNYPLIVPPNNQQANIRLHAQSGQFIFFDSDCKTEDEFLMELEQKFSIIKLEVKLNSTDDISNLEKSYESMAMVWTPYILT